MIQESKRGRTLLAISTLLLIAIACACPPSNLDLRTTALTKVVEYASPMVMKVKATLSMTYGSGVLIRHENKNYVLTCQHIFEMNPHQPLRVETLDDGDYEAKYVRGDSAYDLALLYVEELQQGRCTMELSYDVPIVGENILVLGYPAGCGFGVSTGIISGVGKEVSTYDRLYGGSKHYCGLILTDAPINPGNSGGPVVDITGRLVGIAQLTKMSYDGIGMFISTDRIREFLNGANREGLDRNVLREGGRLHEQEALPTR